MRAALVLLVLAAPSGCAAPFTDPPAEVARLDDARVREASGIAASRRYPGLFYIHNDSGDRAQVFLVNRAGRTRAVITLRGAAALDYEDIALAPGAASGTWDVVVADIGDNEARRPNITLYRFPEPDLPAAEGGTITVAPTAFQRYYVDGPRNAEALCIHPRTGVGYIITKQFEGAPEVYRIPAPWQPGSAAVARVGELATPPVLQPLRVVTAADISPDGQRLAVRCVVHGWEFTLAPEAPDEQFEQIFVSRPQQLDLPAEPQGEALGYAADGQALLTVSEGVHPPLYELQRPVIPAASRPATVSTSQP